MKRILILTALTVALVGAAIAQRKPSKAAQKTEKREEKREKEIIKDQRKAAHEADKAARKQDGTPDMRYAANRHRAEEAARKERERLAREREKERERAAKATARAQRPEPPHPRIIPQPVNRSGDRIIGTDAKGRTIYQGPRGGRYYINKNGNKEYIK